MSQIIDAIVNRADRGQPLAVCVLAKTRGSTPQKAGAIMLVTADGQTLGTIGGGCTEAEARTEALRALTRPSDRPAETTDDGAILADRLLRFELNHDYGWDDGLVCGGVMHVVVQVIDRLEAADAWRHAQHELAVGRPARTRLRVTNEHGELVELTHEAEPRPSLIIAGGGHVGQALAAIADPAGFDVTVVDDRADTVSAARFPDARRVVGEIEAELRKLTLHDHSYVVIVTRGHKHDGQALEAVIRSDARYIGLIGSRRKVLAIYETLLAQGVSPDQLRRVHAPIGLRIGAVSPEEIAVSIAAELIAVRHDQPLNTTHAMRLDGQLLDQLIDRQVGVNAAATDPARPSP
ncbi:MAG: XdhC/CoxI family protein [Planctomycetota bacterium]